MQVALFLAYGISAQAARRSNRAEVIEKENAHLLAEGDFLFERLAYEPVVFAVCADPEPMDAAAYRQAECPVVQADSDAVKSAVTYCLEVQRWVRRICLDVSVVPMREGLNLGGQRLQALPETL